jgi:hypothetical protein
MSLRFKNKSEALKHRSYLLTLRKELNKSSRNYRKDFNALTQEINEVNKWIKDNWIIPRGLLASHPDFESGPRRFDSYLGSLKQIA